MGRRVRPGPASVTAQCGAWQFGVRDGSWYSGQHGRSARPLPRALPAGTSPYWRESHLRFPSEAFPFRHEGPKLLVRKRRQDAFVKEARRPATQQLSASTKISQAGNPAEEPFVFVAGFCGSGFLGKNPRPAPWTVWLGMHEVPPARCGIGFDVLGQLVVPR